MRAHSGGCHIISKHCKMFPVSRSLVSLLTRSTHPFLSVRFLSSNEEGIIHNIGLIAHIDAGKTTTTERMVYYSGLTSRVGNVDRGNTVMDYLPTERERGITISSAAISIPWSGCTLNLIDTPGHADFTFEVERTLHVLDGAIVLLDAASGVEAQTVAVWRQAKFYKVPSVAYVNKMDNTRACLHSTVESIRQQLDVCPVLTQLPLGSGKEFHGVVDLVQMQALVWPQGGDGRSFSPVSLDTLPLDTQRDACQWRELLVEQVAMNDDELANQLLARDDPIINHNQLTSAIHRTCQTGSVLPVLCGSALRGVAVQPLMNAITDYLPQATQLSLKVPARAQGLCVYTFKQVFDTHRGLLAYVRVFSGSLKPNSTIYNLTCNTSERVTRILMAQADQLQEVKEAGAGRIAVVMGLKHTSTGDTLVQSVSVARSLESEGSSLFKPPCIPPPVFLSTIEPISAVNQKNLDEALTILSREDPSLRVSSDPDTGQTVLSGMGELHLEVVEERLRRVYRVPSELGKLQVAYRECLLEEVKANVELVGTNGTSKYSAVAMVTLTPHKGGEGIELEFSSEVDAGRNGDIFSTAIVTSLTRGPVLGFPVQRVCVCVDELTGQGPSPPPFLAACLSQAIQKALQKAKVSLLEPLTELHVVAPEEFVGDVLSDLTANRRALVQSVSDGDIGRESVVRASVPLASLMGYANDLRSMTRGTATLTMTISGYSLLDSHQQTSVVKQIRGY